MLPERRRREITLAVPLPQDWERFCAWARHEGWRVPARELALYRNELAASATVLYEDQVPCGFITVCRHQRHAWIGNLIVDPVRRGEGLGRQLFEHAVGCLADRGVGTLWLTASPAGLPLYQSAGFREVGRIERWILPINGKAQAAAGDLAKGDLYELVRADAAAWGHSRAELLCLQARGGQLFAAGSTRALLQPGTDLRVLGPWLSADLCPRANRTVLSQVLGACDGAGEIAADVVGGSPVRLLLKVAGFHQTGETVLMMRGASGAMKIGEIVALASLGSMG